MYGVGWLEETWRMIREDEIDELKMLKLLAPLARSAMDKNTAQGLDKYSKSIDKLLDNSVPWRPAHSRRERLLRNGMLKPGEVAVILDAGEDANNPLFEDVKIIRD